MEDDIFLSLMSYRILRVIGHLTPTLEQVRTEEPKQQWPLTSRARVSCVGVNDTRSLASARHRKGQ